MALGGNALLRRGQPMTVENQRANVALACDHLAAVAATHELVISHGNGPQIGLLALEGAAYEPVPVYPLDVLGAETQGMVGYLIQQELGNRLSFERPLATLLTMIEVDPTDPAFADPSKPIGPLYTAEEAAQLERDRGWTFRPDGAQVRRVVPSPAPKRIFEHRQISWLLDAGCVVICAGGGGIPTAFDEHGKLHGIEAVIDKDHASGLLSPRSRRRRVRDGDRHPCRLPGLRHRPAAVDHRGSPRRRPGRVRRRVRRRVDAAQGHRRL